MCDWDPPAVFRSIERVARKEHRCCECKRPIMPGDKYEFCSGVWEGRGASFKTCEGCALLREHVVAEDTSSELCWPEFGALLTHVHEMYR